MPGANPVTPVISALFFLAGRCQGWVEMPEKVEGSGQRRRWQQDTRGGGRRSQPLGGYCELLVSPWGCAGGGSSAPTLGTPAPPCWVGLVTLSCPQSSGGGRADPSSPEVFAALSTLVTPPTAPVPALLDCPQPPELPLKGLEVPSPSCPFSCQRPGPSSQPAPGHAWEAVPGRGWKHCGLGIVLSWE